MWGESKNLEHLAMNHAPVLKAMNLNRPVVPYVHDIYHASCMALEHDATVWIWYNPVRRGYVLSHACLCQLHSQADYLC